ncbi:MAG: aldo/keto reductase, partial [Coriobacteriales bacterium]|nr:aldo/keto reductase [Coriobacteriales bacterium]
MQYRQDPRTGRMLSALGFGLMRLPRGLTGIDVQKATDIVREAVERGVNYFDTAYIYPGSEEAFGKVLA